MDNTHVFQRNSFSLGYGSPNERFDGFTEKDDGDEELIITYRDRYASYAPQA